MLEDDVELRVCADVALEVDPEGQRLDIFGDQPGGDARCARRFVKAGADGARDPERRVIDGDGDFLQPQFAAVSADRKPEVERRAAGEGIERAPARFVRTEAKDDVQLPAAIDVGPADRVAANPGTLA